jgi:hypothetical protein
VIEVVVIPADPVSPVRVDSLLADDLAGFQRLVGGGVAPVYVDDGLYLFTTTQARPVNPRACLLTVVLDPDFSATALRGDVVVVGGHLAGSVTSAPQWLRDLCDRPGRFQVVELTAANITEPQGLVVRDVFVGLALLAGMNRRAPNRKFLLHRLDDEQNPGTDTSPDQTTPGAGPTAPE